MIYRSKMYKSIKWSIRIVGVFFALILSYLLFAIVLSLITINSGYEYAGHDSVEIMIQTNGVHTDLVLPFRNDLMDWGSFVDPGVTSSGISTANYISFGWGDREFYLQTQTWDDLSAQTALRALFLAGDTAIHVHYYFRIVDSDANRRIIMSGNDYLKLVNYIVSSFRLDEDGAPILIDGFSYSSHDAFYEAQGTFTLFRTCNTWVNSGLKTAGLPASFWTPFDKGIFIHYRLRNEATVSM